MKKPRSRTTLLPRQSDNDHRRLDSAPDPARIQWLLGHARYRGRGKHKGSPAAFGLEPEPKGDATLCDDHAGFLPDAAPSIPRLLKRGISAGLIGPGARMLWTVGDDGWIFEARITNSEQSEYHGYPVRQTEAIAEKVYQRFVAWAAAHGGAADQQAATLCQQLYGFRT
jgi:hypothetical protein